MGVVFGLVVVYGCAVVYFILSYFSLFWVV